MKKTVVMTFKDLRKRIGGGSTLEPQLQQQQQTRLFDICKDKPFWICDIDKHKTEDIRTKGDCCFNHIIGLPKKASVEKPIFDYNAKVTETLERRRKMQISRSIFTSA